MEDVFYVGVDVGTASVRAALVSSSGLVRSVAQEPIRRWEPHTDHYVQSSTDIWDKCCTVVKVRHTPHLSVNGIKLKTTDFSAAQQPFKRCAGLIHDQSQSDAVANESEEISQEESEIFKEKKMSP